MSLKVSKWTIISMLYSIVLFCPQYLMGTFVKMLSNALLIIIPLLLLKHRYRPSTMMIIFIAYTTIRIGLSFYYKTDAADIHLVIPSLKLCLMLACMELGLRERSESTIRTMLLVLLVFVMLDAGSVFMFPEGMYHTEIQWNEWSSAQFAHWIYGNKNNRVIYYLSLIMLVAIGRYQDFSSFNIKAAVMLCVLSIGVMLITKSSTSMVVIASILFTLLFFMKRNNIFNKINIKPKLILGVYFALEATIIVGQATFLGDIIKSVFGKDLTFTGRTEAWQSALLLISQKPILGYGVVGAESTTELLGSQAFVNAHNMFVDSLLCGGIVLLFVVFAAIWLILTQCEKITDSNMFAVRNFAVFILLALMVEGTFEILVTFNGYWFIMCYLHYVLNNVIQRANKEGAIDG